jgi:23S rRNA pseudouridine1911/1915/1917 synthase
METSVGVFCKDTRILFEGAPLVSAVHQRLDLFLVGQLNKTRSSVQRLIRQGHVRVNGQRVKPGYRIRPSDRIEVCLPEEREENELIPQPIPVEILYRDEYIIVVNKPPGIVMYPAYGHRDGSLMNAIAYTSDRLASVGGPLRPGVVHRLDKDTSGVVVVALDDKAYYGLVEQFKKRLIKKEYLAIVHGLMKEESGEINRPIGRSASHRKKFSIRTRSPKEAKTYWNVVDRFKDATLLRIRLTTGRTHQIRVHLSSIGHPVLGDSLYGRKTTITINNKRIRIPRQMLHAESLSFVHPVTEQVFEFHTSIPEDMQEIIEVLRQR